MDENQTLDHDRIMKINIEEEMKSSYIDYTLFSSKKSRNSNRFLALCEIAKVSRIPF